MKQPASRIIWADGEMSAVGLGTFSTSILPRTQYGQVDTAWGKSLHKFGLSSRTKDSTFQCSCPRSTIWCFPEKTRYCKLLKFEWIQWILINCLVLVIGESSESYEKIHPIGSLEGWRVKFGLHCTLALLWNTIRIQTEYRISSVVVGTISAFSHSSQVRDV